MYRNLALITMALALAAVGVVTYAWSPPREHGVTPERVDHALSAPVSVPGLHVGAAEVRQAENYP